MEEQEQFWIVSLDFSLVLRAICIHIQRWNEIHRESIRKGVILWLHTNCLAILLH